MFAEIKKIVTVIAILFTAPLALGAGSAPAPEMSALAIQLGAPFCDNAILQREMPVPVWGWSKPGTTVSVEFAGQKKTTIVGKDGNSSSPNGYAVAKWRVWLDPMKASFEPREMVVTETPLRQGSGGQSTGKKVVLQNILVGEVWLASGQSNMQQSCTKTTCSGLHVDPVGDSKVNPIREFEVKSTTAQLHPIEKSTGYWKDGGYSGYSAIAFAFAHKVYGEIQVPIGILNCSWSQTAIEAWIPRQGYATGEDEFTRNINLKCLQTDPRTPEHKEAWDAFYKSLEDQIAANTAAIEKGEKAREIDANVPGNMHSNRDANWLFCGRLNPVIPYAIRGAIWNQGWANRGGGLNYYNNLHSMIRGWRIVWDNPDLPVYFHQFYCPDNTTKPSIDGTAEMRLGTWMARDIPNSGMASQIDIGGAIHYSNKAVPGQRLALLALKNQYGEQIVAEGPMFESYKVKGDKVIVEFGGAKGGLVVADTEYNRKSKNEDATGFADPKIIENGEDKVKLFWLTGEDRVWHPATFKIDGDEVIVQSDAVKQPRGVSYGSGGIGFQPCLYNKALLPMTPFIQYDNKMVTTSTWPDKKLKIAGETIDPSSVGKLYEYRKMPVLSVQFRDDAVFQADKPVTIWGATRNFGEWQSEPEEGECEIHFEFGDIKKTIPVKDGMPEWQVTLPPMKADGKTYTLKVQFTIDGELAHERIAENIVFGDVFYVAAPPSIGGASSKKKKGDDETPVANPSGQIVRMIENQSKRGGNSSPSRFSICTSRTPKNRFAAYWQPATGVAARIGHSIAAKTKRPVGIIWMQAKPKSMGRGNPSIDDNVISKWMAPEFLKDAPSLMEDYKTVGSQYPDNPYYLANVRRYIADWKSYWGDYIPEMIETKAVPEGTRWGANWGSYPSPKPQVGDSVATQIYNIYVLPFSPAALKGVIFFSGEAMVKENEGANFGPEMAALAKSFKAKFGGDVPVIYTVPSKTLAPKITQPEIEGAATALEISDWKDVQGVIEKVSE